MLVWQWFGVPLIPIYAPLFSIRVPLVPICVILSTSSPPPTNIFCLYPPHPISRYFCKESLITPPPPPITHQPTSSLFTVNVTPPKIFIVLFPSFSIRVHSFSIRVHSCSLVFIRVHSCSLVFIRVPFVFHSCSLVFIRVPLVFTRVPLVFTRVHSCSLVFIRVHSCSFVFRSVWCFRYDLQKWFVEWLVKTKVIT